MIYADINLHKYHREDRNYKRLINIYEVSEIKSAKAKKYVPVSSTDFWTVSS